MSLSVGKLQTLIVQARDGDAAALDQLCTCYRPYLRLIARSLLSPAIERRTEASDIVQLTEIEITRAIKDFRGSSEPEFSGWLKQILRRNIADAVRDNRAAKRDLRREQCLDAISPETSISWFQPAARDESPSRFVMNGEAALHVARALEELPADQCEVVRLRHIEGLKLQEIADLLDKSPGAVAGLLRRGLQAMRNRMGSESRFL